MIDHTKPQRVGPGNYYGCLTLCFERGQYYWAVENHDGYKWEPIPDYLAKALIKFNKEGK